MATVVAVANQKGGVAKTTTVHTLAEALTERGKTVLMIDLDPQAFLTYASDSEAESIGILTINALTAADPVLIPFQAETLSHRGV